MKKAIEKKTTETRINEIDVAKGIGILLVVFAHINYTPFLWTYIYSFHMPLFFVLSGLVYNRERYSSFSVFLKQKVKTLICPYVIFAVAFVCFECVILIYGEGFSDKLFETALSGFINIFLARGSADFYNAPLWFVLCLFLVEMLYYFISKTNRILTLIICFGMVFLGWFLESGHLDFNNKALPWSVDSAFLAIGFFALGNIYSERFKLILKKINESNHRLLILSVIIVACIGITIPLSIMNGKISLGSKILNNGFLLYFCGIAGTVGVLALSAVLKRVQFLRWCGKNSFYIMATHYLIREFLRYIYKFFDIPMYDKTKFIETVIPFVMVCAISFLFTLVYTKTKAKIFLKTKKQ